MIREIPGLRITVQVMPQLCSTGAGLWESPGCLSCLCSVLWHGFYLTQSCCHNFYLFWLYKKKTPDIRGTQCHFIEEKEVERLTKPWNSKVSLGRERGEKAMFSRKSSWSTGRLLSKKKWPERKLDLSQMNEREDGLLTAAWCRVLLLLLHRLLTSSPSAESSLGVTADLKIDQLICGLILIRKECTIC